MTKDMTTGAITPLLVKFTIPLVLGNLFQLTYNAADSIIVGKFVGEDALAAVGTSNPLMTLAILFINGLCLGAGILVSTAYGAGDTQRVERQVSTTAIAGTVFSLVFSALCVLLATPLLRLMQVPEEILPIAVQYLRIVFAGLIFTFFYNFLAATMRALGDSKSALYFLMISAVLNIGGDLFFVEVLGWGSEGCALSTVLSEALCCVLCVVYIQFKVPVLQLGRRWLVFDGSLLRSTVRYGWTSAMQQATVQLGKIAVQAEMSFDNVLASVQSGKADIAISGISATKERQKIFDFSDTYYESETVLVVKKDATETYKQTSDFAKKSVAVQKGSIQENIAKANLSDANVVSLAQPGEAINELKSGQVEGVVLEKAIAQGYVEQNSDLAMSDIALKSDSNDAYAVAMPKGSDELKAKVNKVIAKLKKEGKIDSYVQDAYALSLKSSSK